MNHLSKTDRAIRKKRPHPEPSDLELPAHPSVSLLLPDILNAINDAVLALDTRLCVLMFNPALAKRFQSTFGKQVTLGMSLPDALADLPEEQARVVRLWRRALAGETFTVVRAFDRPGHVYQISETRYSPLRDEAGQIIGAVFVSRDVTEGKWMEQRLRENTEQLQMALRSARMGTWCYDIVEKRATFSDELGPLFGMPSGEGFLNPEHFQEAVHPEDRPAVAESIRRRIEEGEEGGVEFRLQWPDGSWHWLAEYGSLVRGEDGSPCFMAGVVRDIEARKQQEIRLEESEARFHAQYRGLPVPTYTWQWTPPDFVLIDYNDAAQVLTQGRIDTLSGATARALYSDTPEILEDMQRCFREQTIFHKEITYRLRSTGETRNFAVSYVSIPHDLVMVHAQDITEHKQLEAQFLQAQKMESIGRLAGGIAHDFNNLLSIILGYSELTEARLSEDSPLRANLRIMTDAANRATSLTRQLLSFARRQPTEPKIMAPGQLIETMSQMLRPLIGEDITLHTQLDAPDARVRIDPHQLEQALVNLVVNARDAMPEGGLLTLSTREEFVQEDRRHPRFVLPTGAYVCLSVSDTGAGMTEEVQSKLFEPFFTTKVPGRGTGLGLASVYGIVKQNDGFIFVQSIPGQGSTFHLYLPKVEGQESEAVAVTERGGVVSEGKTVLVVEDEPLLREMTTVTLRKNGYTILEAGDGVEALEVAEAYPGEIHLLLTDAIMPQMGGRELAERLLQARPGIQILLASGYSEDRFLETQPFPEGTAFLPKPFTPKALRAKVCAVLA